MYINRLGLESSCSTRQHILNDNAETLVVIKGKLIVEGSLLVNVGIFL